VIKKSRINVILPENMSKEIRQRMLKDNYSLREKSRWISEAIEEFLKLHDYHNFVEMANLVADLTHAETIHITSDIVEQLENAVLQVRKEHPVLEGVKSLIVRASVIRRLVLLSTPKQSSDRTAA
jgi:metal-responsive CopG/Arc/MetJ family transcriptional regulator